MKWHTAYLSIGSNLGSRKEHLRQARELFQNEHSQVLYASRIFETEPVGAGTTRWQPWFLNLALGIRTRLSPQALLGYCQSIEDALGRERPYRHAPRTLDVDILLYEDRVLAGEELTIPHPRMLERRFVLAPLAEIAGDVVHPLRHRPVRTLLASCPDTSVVRFLR